MSMLGNGLHYAGHHEDELSVREAEVSMLRRVGADEETLICAQSNLAGTYSTLGQSERALAMYQDCYSGNLKLEGEEHRSTLIEAYNYANCLVSLQRHAEAKSLLRKTLPVARRVLGEGTS